MSEYNWCHGPHCHKRETTNRVRGVKGNKVLRTVKIRSNNWTKGSYWEYFCDHTCLMSFVAKHYQELVRLHPRPEALETPINVTKEKYENHWGNHVRTNIELDESRNIG